MHSNEWVTAAEDAEYETEHEHRKREMATKDIVHTIDLRDYFQTQVKSLYAQLGETHYSEIMKVRLDTNPRAILV